MKSTKLAQVAGILLALALTFSCSSGGGSSEQSYSYCIIAGNTCLTGPFTASTCTGQLSNSCPNGSSPSIGGSSSSVGSSSSKGSSSSSGGGGSFNVNSQVYNEDGTLYIGNGIIEATTGVTYSNGGHQWDHINAGNVTNGIVQLELPQTIPNEYLSDFFDEETQRSCTSYPENIKMFGGDFVLTNSNKDYIGSLSTQLNDGQIFELFTYVYFTKAGKITCNLEYDITNIDAKVGWNKMYIQGNGNSTIEYSTNNILTKEMKWILE